VVAGNGRPANRSPEATELTADGAGVQASPFSRKQALIQLAATSASSRSVNEASEGGTGRIAVVLGRFDALLAHGLEQILREDRNIQIIGSDLDRAALEQAVEVQAPRVALVDEAEVMIDRAVLERMTAAQPAIGIVVLAHLPTVAYVMRLFAGGASCVAKEASADDILAAVHIAANGRRVFADVEGHLVERSHATVGSLTSREMEVLEYLGRGRSHAEIANAMQLGVETVRTHSAHIRSKLGVRRNRDLIGVPIPVWPETGIRSDAG
jgi:DNA-binding NarL/FixJ family response regulator